jgi:hypothetical protein
MYSRDGVDFSLSIKFCVVVEFSEFFIKDLVNSFIFLRVKVIYVNLEPSFEFVNLGVSAVVNSEFMRFSTIPELIRCRPLFKAPFGFYCFFLFLIANLFIYTYSVKFISVIRSPSLLSLHIVSN